MSIKQKRPIPPPLAREMQQWYCPKTHTLSLRHKRLKWGIWHANEAEAIEWFKELEILDLAHNIIDYVPFDWTKLPRLKCVDFSNNDLGYWHYERPTKLGNNWNFCDSLEWLSVKSNKLTYFGFREHNLQRLQYVDVSNNIGAEFMYNTGQVPPFSFTLNLPALPALRELRLRNNNYREFPAIFHLNTLETVDLSYNKLTALPVELARLQRLRRLDVSCNRLRVIPEAIIRELPNLRELCVKGNSRLGRSYIMAMQEKYPHVNIEWQTTS